MNNTNTFTGAQLWDEIFKAIVHTMPEQLFPLFKEVFGKEYPPGTPIRLLATEHSTYPDSPGESPSSTLMDIALLVADTDYYHLECQMHNDQQMVLRMISYDLHFALRHTVSSDSPSKELTIRFPRSAVIYPDQNSSLPDSLRCRILFPDQSEHIYQIPTVRVQSYSLAQIHEKHLNLFLPYTLLRLKPRLKHVSLLTKEELTAFINEIIVILEEDVSSGHLTRQESYDYIQLLIHASKHIFQKYPKYHEEVLQVTKPLIKLPSVELREALEAQHKLQAELADKKAEIESIKAEIESTKAEIESSKAELENSKAELESSKAELESSKTELESSKAELESNKAELESNKAEIESKNAELESNKSELAEKDAEIARLRKLLLEAASPIPQT